MQRNLTFPRIMGFAAMACVWLNLSNTYLLVSALSGLPFKYLGAFFMTLMMLYLMANRNTVFVTVRKPQVLFFLIVFAVLPALSTVIAPILIIRFAIYIILCALIFLTVMIWIQKEGWESFSKVIILSWAVGIVGIILSYFFPALFERIAYMQADASVTGIGAWEQVRVAQESQGRAFGFYMQSNRACLALTIHLLILLPVYFHNKPTWRMLLLGITFFAVLLTGSRGGFLYMVILTILLFLSEITNGIRYKHGIQSGFNLLPRYLILGMLAVGAIVIAEAASYDKESKADESAVDRILSSFFGNSTSLAEDTSVQARLMAQNQYIRTIIRSPIWGHGLGASEYAKYTGDFYLSSHNNILETAYNYGIPIACAMYGFFAYLCYVAQSRAMRDFFRYNLSWITFLVLLAASFVTNTLFDYRIFPTLMAFWLTMLYFPTSSHPPIFRR